MSQRSTRFSRLLGWMPAFLLAGLATFGWAIFLRGHFPSILAWLFLQTALPLSAVLVALAMAVQTIRTRRRIGRLAVTLAFAGFCAWPACWLVGVAQVTYPYRLDSVGPAATVRVPTDSAMRVVWGGDDLGHNRHAAYPDQRWAYDLAVEPVLVGSARLEDYGCWGVPVVAPTSGIVHVAHDGEPDHAPGKPSADSRASLGNHVVIALPSGTFVVIAHLRKGSVRVREGMPLGEGDVLGACGNSGNTSEPHVHIHHQRQDPRGRPVNFAEGLPLFFRDHEAAPMPLGGIAIRGTAATPVGATIRHHETTATRRE